MYCVPWGISMVRGNNDKDWAENLRTSLSFTIGGVKFFMVHNKKTLRGSWGHTGGHLRAYSQIF